jgi:hypothetical protein
MKGTGYTTEDVFMAMVSAMGGIVVFAHQGEVGHAKAEELLSLAEQAVIEAGDPVVVRKRLAGILMEGVENMHRYAHEPHAQGCFTVLARTPSGYRLLFGNVAQRDAADRLEQQIDAINALDPASLKERYLAVLSNGLRTEKGGAGLGLLTMAKKSANRMSLQRYPTGEGDAVVVLEVEVTREREGSGPPADQPLA